MAAQKLGFIGLGRMGSPIATRLVEAGYAVRGYDRAGTEDRIPRGGVVAASVAEIAIETEIVLLSVPDGAVSVDVVGQLAATPHPRVRVVIDLSTIGIAAAHRCAAMLEGIGRSYVDAPVSGGVSGAKSGGLAMMIGASEQLVSALDPILSTIASHRFRVGDQPGQGQAMKLLNNFLSATTLAATSEAVTFGARMGLDLETIIEVLNVSSGRSAASEEKFPSSILPGTYDYGFAGALMAKDVALYLQSAEENGAPHDIASAVTTLWEQFNVASPDADFTLIYQYLNTTGQ
jgi:3-hydroxyisobutyrate dehydrogenase